MNLYSISFDQYQRYQFTKDIINLYRNNCSIASKYDILDVGGISENKAGKLWLPAKEFFIKDNVTVLDTIEADLTGYIKGDGTCLPFKDGEYDIVISNDVLEHLKDEQRIKFINELLRCAKEFVVLTFPYHNPANVLAEQIFYETILKHSNIDHGMLGEHLRLDLPDLDQVLSCLEENEIAFSTLKTGNTYNWLLYNYCKQIIPKSTDLSLNTDIIDEYINRYLYEQDIVTEPSYRATLILSKNSKKLNIVHKVTDQILDDFKNKSHRHDFQTFLNLALQLIKIKDENSKHISLDQTNEPIISVTEPLKDGNELIQKVHITSDNLCRIGFIVGTHNTKQQGHLLVELQDNYKQAVYKKVINIENLIDNDWHFITFPPILNSEYQDYYLKFVVGGSINPGISFWCGETNLNFPKAVLQNQEINQSICLRVYRRCFYSNERSAFEISNLVAKVKELESKQVSILNHLTSTFSEYISRADRFNNYKTEFNREILTEIKNIKLAAQSFEDRMTYVEESLNSLHELNKKSAHFKSEITDTLHELSVNIDNTLDQVDERLKIEEELMEARQRIDQLNHQINLMCGTKGWRLLEVFRKVRNGLRKDPVGLFKKLYFSFKAKGVNETIKAVKQKASSQQYKAYDAFVRSKLPTEEQIKKISEEIDKLGRKPVISIVMPVYNTDEKWLRLAIESVINQVYPYWELCICDDNSSKEHVKRVLEEYKNKDSRIKVTYSDISLRIAGATNKAIELATGEYIGLLDHDDELTVDALYEVAKVIINHNPDLIYSDEDKIEMDGTFCEPFFKPDWSPDYILSVNYICHFLIIKRSLILTIGGLRNEFEGSQDHDLILRVTERTNNKIHHIGKVLYHWRKVESSTSSNINSKKYAWENGQKAIQGALNRRNIQGKVQLGKAFGHYRVIRDIIDEKKVSIIIPIRDKVDLLKKCIQSIENETTYKNYEIIVVDNGSKEQKTLDYLNKIPYKKIHLDVPFNYSYLNNQAVKVSSGDYILLLNNDIEVINSDWLKNMVEHIQRPEVGVVGAMLYYSNNTIQHAGVVLGLGGVAGHSHKYFTKGSGGYNNTLFDIRNYSAVTGACMLLKKELYEKVNGLDEKNLAVAFNDVDLCLKIRELGYLCVFTPYAELYHHESISRGKDLNVDEVKYMQRKWQSIINRDPYYNVNLTLDKEDFSLKLK